MTYQVKDKECSLYNLLYLQFIINYIKSTTGLKTSDLLNNSRYKVRSLGKTEIFALRD